jgi:hypothetical protein
MSSEAERFDATVRKILSVSHEELKRREAEWKRQRQIAKKKRKPKASAEDRVLRGKD